MSEDADLIAWSLNEVAERHGDPTPEVYRRLFAENPETEALFVRDTDGSIRGNMLAMVFESLLDLAGPGAYGEHMIRAEIVNHDGFGVPPVVFASFFRVVKATLRDLMGREWTAEVDAAWDGLLAKVEAGVSAHA